MKTGNETANGNEVEWQGIGRWLAAAWRSVSRRVPSPAHRSCTSSSFQRKFVTMRRRIESITWCHMLKSPRRTCWLAARRWRKPNTSLGTILFELLKNWQYSPPWFSPTEPKTVDQNQRAKAYWDVLVYAKNTEVRVNTIDVRKINKEDNKVRKTEKQGVGEDHEICATSSVLSSRCRSVDPGVIISITVDVLGGASMNTAKSIKALMRERPGKKTLRKMKKSVLSHSLNIARSFKILT